jgi:hypothetical protein
MFRRARVAPPVEPGDVVIRRHRLLKTLGIVLRFDGTDDNGAACAWIKWSHPTTLPNPSLEPVDDLELVEGRVPADARQRPSEDGAAATAT